MGERAEQLERPMLGVAALVIPAIVLEESDVGATWHTVAAVLNWAIWLAFLGELVAMLAVVRDRRGYLLHNPLRVVIVLLTPPFLPSLFQGLRALRLLRLLRLLWLLPMFKLAFTLRGLQYASVFTLLVVLAGAAAFENAQPDKSYFDGVYWAVSTMTTVGYGVEVPTTVAARVIAMALMIVGVGYFAVVTGAIAERFIERGEEEELAELEAGEEPDELLAQADRLALRARELALEIDALRASLATRG
jgi:voltage-gated potassium channel